MKVKITNVKLLIVMIMIMVSCKNETEVLNIDATVDPPLKGVDVQESTLGYEAMGRSESDCHFEYEGELGPDHWANLCSGVWSDCAGNTQSPVNIVTSNTRENDDLDELYLGYKNSYVSILNNGHTVQFTYSPGSYSYLNGKKYELKQFHFHTESEHTVNGKHYPMEVHFVHKDVNSSNLAVVGVFFVEGRENKVLAQFMNTIPTHAGDTYDSNYIYNAKEFFRYSDEDTFEEYYTYGGSLTTPPCSEIVTWYVLKEPLQASASQIENIRNAEHENNRPTQPLNGRVVEVSED
ncbi:carbonic anhydrase [Tenacibaculum sp. TC6]|uniref:carbonic anhydrase n=1 Tax=Tenacibaculum sp. TC6 TaxID=3423223 RepID=UPI003D365E3D